MFIQSTMLRLFVLIICCILVHAIGDLIYSEEEGFGTKIVFEDVVAGQFTDNSISKPVSLADFKLSLIHI